MRWCRATLTAALTAMTALSGAVVAGAVPAVPAAAATTSPDYEMPFPCGQQWTGTSRATHSPSPRAVDFNRDGDFGDLVVASAPGTVSRVANLGDTSYGRYVIVDHGNGDSTLYAHLSRISVAMGQHLDQGSAVGLVGASGSVTAAHLHFEERVNGTDQPAWFHAAAYAMGTTQASASCPDVPVAGDWDGNSVAEVGVFRRAAAAGFFRLAQDGQPPAVIRFGRSSDTPVTGDWDGDGRTDVGVRRPGTRRFLLRNADGSVTTVLLGGRWDVPVTGDWDGDGRTDVGVFRPASATFTLLTAAGTQSIQLGTVGVEPVSGDWNGDGVSDLGVYDPATATFTLRMVTADGSAWLSTIPFGGYGDLPVAGDWNGDGTTDLGTWSPATATFSQRVTAATGRTTATATVRFGRRR